jgi:hypothetical protein
MCIDFLVMFDLKLFIISLVSPFGICLAALFLSYLSEIIAALSGSVVIFIYLEHLFFASVLGIKQSDVGGGFIPMPLAPWVFMATLIINYIISVFLIYILLLFGTKLYKYFS